MDWNARLRRLYSHTFAHGLGNRVASSRCRPKADKIPPMRRADVIARISATREELTKQFGVRSLALFGSVARDEARPDSDVDVLVEFEGPTTFDAHMGLLVFLEDLLACRVDVVTAKGLKPRLRPLIDRDLVRVA